MKKLVLAAWKRGGCLCSSVPQVPGRHVPDELARLAREFERILHPDRREGEDRRPVGEGVEERIGARLIAPSTPIVVTQPIGRGAMIDLKGSCRRIDLSRFRGVEQHVASLAVHRDRAAIIDAGAVFQLDCPVCGRLFLRRDRAR